MTHIAQRVRVSILLSTVLMATTPAMAYVEPGTGNLMLQLLFGGLTGMGLLCKLYWKNLWQGFKALKPMPPTNSQPEPVAVEPQGKKPDA